MAARAETSDKRHAMYARLVWRNRLVSVLRLAVPVVGAVAFIAITGQLYLASIGTEFSIGSISVDRNRLLVQTPDYAGVTADGSSYRVTAARASAAMNALDSIDLEQAKAVLTQTTGRVLTAEAAAAQLQTAAQQVKIDGVTQVSDSGGTTGTLEKLFVDWAKQSIDATGPVHLNFDNGMVLQADGLHHVSSDDLWTFTGATLTVPIN
ncbi:MAG TPA: hypothetical protein VGM83_20615 [Devosiaceae bacterium]|jgi:hypothetical protein